MSYQTALTAAGAVVIDFMYAGSYQGTWGAAVEYQGKRGLVTGAFGSCTVCDAFQAEFDHCQYGPDVISYNAETNTYTKDYGDVVCTKQEYDDQQTEYQQKLAAFGESYLHVIQDAWDIQNQINHLSKDEDDWGAEEKLTLLRWALTKL